MKRKLIKIFIAFIIVVGILTIFVLAEVNDSLSNYDTELICDKEDILYYKEVPVMEYNDIKKEYDEVDRYVSYKYFSNEEVPVEKGEDISKRRPNAQFFPQENGTMVKIYSGQIFFHQDKKWYKIKWANIELDAFNTEIGDGEGLGFFHITLGSIIKFFDIIPIISASATGGRSYYPESDVSVELNPSAGSDNYAMVDEEVADEGATNNYLTVDTTTYDYDFYGIPDHDAALDDYTITSVILYASGFGCDNAICTGAGGGSMQFVLDDAGHAPDYGEEFDLDKARTQQSHDYGITNPLTGEDWTWSDIDGLYVGIGLKEKVATDFYVHLDQVYLLVESTAEYDVGNGDGSVTAHGDIGVDTFSEIRNLSEGTSSTDDGTWFSAWATEYPYPVLEVDLKRAFLPIDTSAIPDDATITSANLKFFIRNVANSSDYRLVQTNQTNTSELVITDYDECGALDNPIAGANDLNINTTGWKTWTLNETGLDWINKTNYTKLGVREIDHDINDVSPNYLQYYANIYSSEASGVEPFLEVFYTTDEDTCSPSTPLIANHLFECSDSCTQSTNLDADGYNITISGAGSFLMNANITNANIVTILGGCKAMCDGGCMI